MPKKKKHLRRFEMGDFVFAKVRFYPAWPAKILKAEKNKFKVRFYGTGETGTIKLENIFQYKENKVKFCTVKKLKRPNFRKAITEIEAALEAEDSRPIDSLNASLPNASECSNVNQMENIFVAESNTVTPNNLLMKANVQPTEVLEEVPDIQHEGEVSK